ncbi:PepSY-associated TM helix domain-containing protein, partial [Craurococcus roseus]
GGPGPRRSGTLPFQAPRPHARAAAAEAAFGADRLQAVVLAGSSLALDQVYLRDDAGGGYLDPGTGAVVARWGANERVVDVLFELHHSLLLGDAGTMAVGVVGLLGSALALSGVVLSWPAARRRFRGTVRPRSGTRGGLAVAHRELGLIAALPLLVLMLSGAAVIFPAAARALLGGVGVQARGVAGPADPAVAAIGWEAVFSAALERFPDAAPRIASWPAEPGAPVVVRLRQPAEWHPNGRTAIRAAHDGRLLHAHDTVAAPLGDRVVDSAYPVHAAKVGGLAYRCAVALSGLALAMLSAYGAVGYARHLFRRAHLARGGRAHRFG